MALPLSRNTTYAPGSQVLSADLNDVQDKIVDANVLSYDLAGADANVMAAQAAHWTRGPTLGYPSMISSDGANASAAHWYCPRGVGRLLAIKVLAFLPGGGSTLKLRLEDLTGGGSDPEHADLANIVAGCAGAWAFVEHALVAPVTLNAGAMRPRVTLSVVAGPLQIVGLVRWRIARV